MPQGTSRIGAADCVQKLVIGSASCTLYCKRAIADKNQMVFTKEEKRSFSTLIFKMGAIKAITFPLIYHLILVMPQGASQIGLHHPW
jgi:hypothetical protein